MLLGDSRVDPGARDNQLLVIVCRQGNAALVHTWWKDKRVDPTDVEDFRIVNVDVIHLLLRERRLDPNVLMNNWTIEEPSSVHLEIVKALLEDPRVEPSAMVCWPFFEDPQVYSWLLKDSRADPSVNDNDAIIKAAADSPTIFRSIYWLTQVLIL